VAKNAPATIPIKPAEPNFTVVGSISDDAITALASLLLSVVEKEQADNDDGESPCDDGPSATEFRPKDPPN